MDEPKSKPNEDYRPVVWTPEDAANFLGNAIKEAQQPLTQALRRQGVPRGTFGIVILTFIAAGAGFFHYLRGERESRDELVREQMRLQQQTVERVITQSVESERRANDVLKEKAAVEAELITTKSLAVENGQLKKREKELLAEIERLKKNAKAMREEVETARRSSGSSMQETIRLRAEVKLMNAQIEGMIQEKEALSKQLTAARKLLKMMHEDGVVLPEAKSEAKLPAPDEKTLEYEKTGAGEDNKAAAGDEDKEAPLAEETDD